MVSIIDRCWPNIDKGFEWSELSKKVQISVQNCRILRLEGFHQRLINMCMGCSFIHSPIHWPSHWKCIENQLHGVNMYLIQWRILWWDLPAGASPWSLIQRTQVWILKQFLPLFSLTVHIHILHCTSLIISVFLLGFWFVYCPLPPIGL